MENVISRIQTSNVPFHAESQQNGYQNANHEVKQSGGENYPKVVIRPSSELEQRINRPAPENSSSLHLASRFEGGSNAVMGSAYLSKLTKSKLWNTSNNSQTQQSSPDCSSKAVPQPLKRDNKSTDESPKVHTSTVKLKTEESEQKTMISDISASKEQDPVQPIFLPERETFSLEVYRKYPWVEYSLDLNQVFCYACRHYSELPDDDLGKLVVYSVTGSERNSKILAIIDEHDQFKKHKKSFYNWIVARNKLLLKTRPYEHQKKKPTKSGKKTSKQDVDEGSPSPKKRKTTKDLQDKLNKSSTKVQAAIGTEPKEPSTKKSPSKSVTSDSHEEPEIKIQKFDGIPPDISTCGDDGPTQPVRIRYPKTKFSSKTAGFCAKWFERYPWLEYSLMNDKSYCFPCRHFLETRVRTSTYTDAGFDKWNKAHQRLQRHQSSVLHLKATLVWMERNKARDQDLSSNTNSTTTTSDDDKPVQNNENANTSAANSNEENTADGFKTPVIDVERIKTFCKYIKLSTAEEIIQLEAVAKSFAGPKWCKCNRCKETDDSGRNICCKHIKQISDKCSSPYDCVTLLAGFHAVCINKSVLQTAYYQHCKHFGEPCLNNTYEKYRFVAFNQFLTWCWGVENSDSSSKEGGGRHEEAAVVPSCVTQVINDSFKASTKSLPALNTAPAQATKQTSSEILASTGLAQVFMRNLLYMSQEERGGGDGSNTTSGSNTPSITSVPSSSSSIARYDQHRPDSAASSSGQSDYMAPTAGGDSNLPPYQPYPPASYAYNSTLPAGNEVAMNSLPLPAVPIVGNVPNPTNSLCDWLDMDWGK